VLQGSPETIAIARQLRRDMSLPKVLLWTELRKRPADLKFRRQQPAKRKVTDFYCHAARLVVEVDGAAHDSVEVADGDAARDAWFAARGIRVLRLPAKKVLKDMDDCIRAILLAAGATT
jgi:very-short-patch-repair endonuclease